MSLPANKHYISQAAVTLSVSSLSAYEFMKVLREKDFYQCVGTPFIDDSCGQRRLRSSVNILSEQRERHITCIIFQAIIRRSRISLPLPRRGFEEENDSFHRRLPPAVDCSKAGISVQR